MDQGAESVDGRVDPMIVVEGADNVGKSTLVKRLLELDSDLRLLKRKRVNPDREETIGSSYIQALIPEDGDFIRHGNSIADRLLASECIYGDLFRGGCRMSQKEHGIIHLLLQTYEAIVVHCDVPDEVILESWKQRDQFYNDPLQIAHAYRQRIGDVFWRPIIRFDWTAPNADEMLHHIILVHGYIQDEIRRSHLKYTEYFQSLVTFLNPHNSTRP